jgi:hypothetical protein
LKKTSGGLKARAGRPAGEIREVLDCGSSAFIRKPCEAKAAEGAAVHDADAPFNRPPDDEWPQIV